MKLGHHHHYDPETDAPALGQLTASNTSSRDLFLIAFVLPFAFGLAINFAINFATALISKPKNRQAEGEAARPSSRKRPVSRQAHQHQLPSPPPLQTYQQLQQQHQEQQQTAWQRTPGAASTYTMDPTAQHQQYSSPQSERPFRRTQAASGRPPSPQSERPFRVTQDQRVYSTPGSEGPNSSSAAAAAAAAARTPTTARTPLTDRPFRVSRTTPHTAGPHSTISPAARAAASPAATDAPFRFRNSEELQHELPNRTPSYPTPSANGVPLLFTSQAAQEQQQQGHSPYRRHGSGPLPQQQQHQEQQWRQQQQQQVPVQQRRAPVWGVPPRDTSAGADQDSDDGDYGDDVDSQQDEALGWDEALLQGCAGQERFISSLEGLQQSSAYRQHVNQARRRNLTLEVKEKHKLDVYKALRRVDPQAFRQLFSRSDVLEYDEVELSRPLAVLEFSLASAITFALLGLPFWLQAWRPFQGWFAAVWVLQQLWVVAAFGCTSLFARVLSIYATQGEYSMRPSCWHLFAAVAVDALLIVGLPVLGVLASLSCKLLTAERQSFGERLLRLQPMREVVRPMHFSPYSPARMGGGSVGSEDYDEY